VAGIDAIVDAAARLAPIAKGGPIFAVAGAGSDQGALSQGGRACYDIDDTVDRIDAPQGPTRAADDFDAIDVFERHVLYVPEDAGKQGRIDRPAIDQHEQLVGRGAVESARADSVSGGGDARHLQIGRQAQRLGQTGGAGAPNVGRGNDEHGGRRIG